MSDEHDRVIDYVWRIPERAAYESAVIRPAVDDDYALVRLTMREWAAVITACEKQADLESTRVGEERYRNLGRRVLLKLRQGPTA